MESEPVDGARLEEDEDVGREEERDDRPHRDPGPIALGNVGLGRTGRCILGHALGLARFRRDFQVILAPHHRRAWENLA